MQLNEQALELLQQHWHLCRTQESNVTPLQLSRCVFFNTPSTATNIFHHTFETFVSTLDQSYTRVYQYQLINTYYANPYAPLLDIIKQEIHAANLDVLDCLHKANVYSLHMPLLLDYLQEGIAQRAQSLIYLELTYEMNEMQLSIINLLCYLSQQKSLIVAISCMHFASPALRKFILAMSALHLPGELMFCISFDGVYHIIDEYEEAWDTFTTTVEDHYPLVNVPPSLEAEKNHDIHLWKAQHHVLTPTLKEVITLSRNLFTFLCFEECAEMIENTLDHLETLNTEHLDTHHTELFITLGYSYCYLNRFDKGIKYFNLYHEHAQITNDHEILTWATLHLAWGNLFKYNLAESEKLAIKCVELSLENNSIALQAASHFALFYILDRSTRSLTLLQFNTLIDLLEQMDFQNHLSYAHRNFYVALRNGLNVSIDDVIQHCNRAIAIGKNLGNISAIAGTYQIKGIVLSYKFNYRHALNCFKVSESFRIKQGNVIDILRIRNSIGYFYVLNEDYENAIRYYHTAFLMLRDVSDDAETSGTIYNIAWLYFCSRNYVKALWVIEQLHKYMRTLSIKHLPFRTINDIYVLQALCHIKQGDTFKAEQNLEKINKSGIASSNIVKYLSTNCHALLCATDDDDQKTINLFETAHDLIDSTVELYSYLLPINDLDYCDFLDKTGQSKQAEIILARIEKRIQKHKMPITQFWIDQIRHQHIKPKAIELPLYQFDIDCLINIADHRVKLEVANQKLRKLNSIQTLQLLAEKTDNNSKLLTESIKLICAHFSAEMSCIHVLHNNHWTLTATFNQSDTYFDFSTISTSYFQNIYQKQSRPTIALNACIQLENSPHFQTTSLIHIPLKKGANVIGNLMLATLSAEPLLHHQDIELLSLIATQLANFVITPSTL